MMKKCAIFFLLAAFSLTSTCFAYTYRGTMTLSNWWPERGANGPEIKTLTVKWMLSDREADPVQAFHMQWYLGDHYVFEDEKVNLREMKVDRRPLSIITLILRAEVHSRGQHVGDIEFEMGATPPHGGAWGQEVSYQQALGRFFRAVGADHFLTEEETRKLFDEDLSLQHPQVVEITFGGLDEIERALGQVQTQSGYLEAIESGDAALRNQAYTEAIGHYEAALQVRPGDDAALKRIEQAKYVLLIQQGDAALDKKDYPAAKDHYTEAAALRPGESIPRERIQLVQQMLDRAGKYDGILEKLRNQYAAEIEKAREAQKKALEMAAMAFSAESEACNLQWIAHHECAESHWQRKASDVETEAKFLTFADEDARRQTQYNMNCSEPACKRFDDASNTFGVTAADYLTVAKRKYRHFTDKGQEIFREQALDYTSRAIAADYQLTAAYLFRATMQPNVMDRMAEVEMALSINPDLPEGLAMQQQMGQAFLQQLHEKIREGDIAYIKKALEKDLIDPEARYEGKTPLEQAVGHEQIGIIEALTPGEGSPRGARVVPVGQQLLLIAARQNKPKVARYLMDKGARPDAANSLGETPLSVATEANATEVIAVLLGKAGVDLSQDASGSMQMAVQQGNPDLVNTFLANGSLVEALTPAGDNLLMVAIRSGHPHIAALLLEKGANPHHSNPLHETPLSLAAVAGLAETTDLLLRAEAEDARSLDFLQATNDSAAAFLAARCLLLAVEENDPERARRAIPFHPHPAAIPATDGASLLDYTLASGSHEICAALVVPALRDSLVEAPDLLMRAIQAEALPVVEALLRAGAVSLSGAPFADPSPLHLAVQTGNAELVHLLLTENHPPNLTDTYGNTPLHIAAEMGRAEVGLTLIRMYADVHIANKRGQQPLHLAARSGNAELFNSLLGAGAAIDALGESGMTALHLAAEEGHAELIALMLKAGAEKEGVDHFGRTPRQIAQQRGDKAVAKLLK